MEVFKVIGDKEELNKFFNLIEKPKFGESLMFCLSARNKKLTDEEKKEIQLGRSEMFHTEISKGKEDYNFGNFFSAISKFEVNKDGYPTKNGKHYPDKALVAYFYLNPCSEIKCCQDTLQKIISINNEFINSALNGDKQIEKYNSVSNHIKACHAQNPSRKVFIDFDIDCHNLNEEGIELIREITKKWFAEGFFLIRTSGGVHVVVKKDRLKFNPNSFILDLGNALLKKNFLVDELKLNGNSMVPIPGTYQYGQIVRIV